MFRLSKRYGAASAPQQQSVHAIEVHPLESRTLLSQSPAVESAVSSEPAELALYAPLAAEPSAAVPSAAVPPAAMRPEAVPPEAVPPAAVPPVSSMPVTPNLPRVTWTGTIQPPTTGRYTFYTPVNSGAKLWVNGVRLSDRFVAVSDTEQAARIRLAADTVYDVRVRYPQQTAPLRRPLAWSSPTQAKAAFPRAALALATPYPVLPKGFTATAATGGEAAAAALASAGAGTGAGTGAGSGRQVQLAWTSGSINTHGFILWRAQGSGSSEQIAVLPAGTTTYTDTGLNDGTTYNYRVQAYNNAGRSAFAAATAILALAAPTELRAAAATTQAATQEAATQPAGTQAVTLNWKNNSTTATGFRITRASNGVDYVLVGTVPSSVTSYTDLVPQGGATYAYQIVAEAPATTTAPATTSAPATVHAWVPLAAPINLTAMPAANVPKITLTWTGNPANQQGYAIERASDGTNFTQIARVAANVSTYTDVGSLKANTSYSYRIRGLAAEGASALSATMVAKTANFRIFDAMAFTGRPDLTSQGMPRIYVGYEHEFFAGSNVPLPNEAATRAVARRAADGGQILVIDIEAWPSDVRGTSEAEVRTTISRFSQVIAWLRDERPGIELGIYGVLPAWPGTSAIRGDATGLASWRAAMDVLRPLADQVDYLFPSLYTHSDDPAEWHQAALRIVEEGKHFGKPVLPFVWMNYHDIDPLLRDRSLPADFWGMELQTLRQHADGIVVWGGYKQRWDPNAAWWRHALSFLGQSSSSSAVAGPTNLSATSTPGIVHLAWAGKSAGEAGFVVERSTDNVSFTAIAMVDASATSYRDTHVLGARYYYRVRATTWDRMSDPSEVVVGQGVRVGVGTVIQAESYDSSSGVGITAGYIGGLDEGRWVKYDNMDFGDSAASVFIAKLAVPSSNAGKHIEVRLDAPDGVLAGVLTIASTGSWTTFNEQSTSVTGITGRHAVYLVFRGGVGVANIDSFRFATGTAPVAPRNVTANADANGRVTLTWDDSTEGKASFRIERSTNGADFTVIGRTTAGSTTFHDVQPLPGRANYYRVRANTLSGGDSAPSEATTVLVPRDAFSLIQAETLDDAIMPVYVTGTMLGGFDGGNWVRYSNIDFGAGVSSMTARVAVPVSNAGKTIELYLGSPTGRLIGTMTIAATQGWSAFASQVTLVSGATGAQDLYLVAKGTGAVANVDWFTFM